MTIQECFEKLELYFELQELEHRLDNIGRPYTSASNFGATHMEDDLIHYSYEIYYSGCGSETEYACISLATLATVEHKELELCRERINAKVSQAMEEAERKEKADLERQLAQIKDRLAAYTK